ncbi:MAG: hypothetical protein J0H94_00400 [Rhizobiales bacterium]|nr:hypothetical protein [Hyphomicrobiales bacterium]
MVAAPLDPAELLRRSDLAGRALVLSSSGGRARLWFTRLTKGRPRGATLWHRLGLARSATVILRQPAEPMYLGDWTDGDAYRPGSRIIVHLAWRQEADAYVSVWWNAVRPAKE